MYAVYKQAHPPTGLEFSMYCNFFSNSERNLVMAGTSQLYVYRLNHDSESTTKSDRNTEGRGHREKLELVASFSFFGNVMSMASVQLAGAKRDALLLSFKDAKLSVVEYDPGTHDLKTLSLHYFEEPELKDGFVQNVHIPKVRVDPDGRCAVMLIYGTRLVVLPFRRDTLTDEHEGVVGEGQKSSFLPSYIIDVRELDEKLLNIIDMQFLYGYYEPTLLILYEPNQTWPGRVAVRQDTCSIVAISLNIMQKVHPVIWSLSNLPFDCTQALAVPKPIGGVVIFAVNSLLYLNQSVPPYGVSLNSLTNGTTVFPLRFQEGVKITLDCAQATFISYDKMMITLEPGYLFLGSRLGNSLLLKYTEKLQEAPMSIAKDSAEKEEPPLKKKRMEQSANWSGGKSAPQDEVDEIEVYGSEAQSGTQLTTYSFEVCDSILNIGPCANAAMGEPAFLSEENSPEPDLEIVVCSGYGKNGALSVLQKSIRPQVVTTFELPGCYDMWTVISPRKIEEATQEEDTQEEGTEKEPSPPEPADDGKRHGFLILSREDSTMVGASLWLAWLDILQTGQEIMELDTSGFATQGPTVYSGNIGENRYIVQVSPLGIRLLEGVNQLHFIPVDLGSPIVHCAVADPYVVIMSSEGQVTMFVLKSDTYGGRTHRLTLQKPPTYNQSRVIALCVYRDVSGMFTTESHSSSSRDELSLRSQSESEAPIQDLSNTVDDEEEMLYGDSSTLFSPTKEEPRRSSLPSADKDSHQYKAEPTHWCMLNFPMGQRVLVDSSFGQPASQGETKKEEVMRQTEMPLVKEVLLVALGNRQSRPYLLVHVDQELLIYEAFNHDSQLGQANLKVRFKKVPHNINFREKKSRPSKKKSESAGGEEAGAPRGRVARFRYFEDIYGYSGVFICGPSPHWLLVTSRGALRLHPMTIDGPIESFAPFHNVNCPKGFLYFNRQVYAVSTSVNNTCSRIPHMTGEEKEFETIERDDRYMHPLQEAFSIQLISPVSWETIPNTSLKDNDLTGMAFIDTQLYIHQMISVKNFILAADVMKSISLLRYQEESKTLSLVSRDAKPLEVYSVDFMVDNAQLGFLGMGLLLPMQEKTYRRLLMLQNALTSMLPHHAGLNPRAFRYSPGQRMLHVDRRILQNAVRNILDGELLNRYLYLSTMERSELAKKIGTTPDIILEDLLEIDRVTAHF
ncbi:Cleavage and polyadenylation specificity factor subunit 1 [Ophiophagus hannah]|uniref:Cleavage and polyadenylation specificity factor subunit 1 n=1 Tax=Ophiophagus hannah TaxID=8665 RepID=V8NF64_OPHHA|nr:Cleavage and polyadenylation specificity factor subunit 1 [Ophiophagus hannah]